MPENRGDGTWRIGVSVHGERIRETIHLDPSLPISKQRKEAEKRELMLQIRAESGELTPPEPVRRSKKRLTVAEAGALWLEKSVLPNLKPTTAAQYESILNRRIIPEIGGILLKDLDEEAVTDWELKLKTAPRHSPRLPDEQLTHKRSAGATAALVSDREQLRPLAPRTVQQCHDVLSDLLAWCVKLHYCEYNVCKNIERPKAPKPRPKYLNESQALDLLRQLREEPNLSYRAGVLLAILCGTRLGEVEELRLSDIDWEKSQIDVSRALHYTPRAGSYADSPKTESSVRTVTLPAGMMEILAAVRDYDRDCARDFPGVWHHDGYIVHTWDGRRCSHGTLSRWFRAFARRHGFPDVTFHALRHTHASMLLASHVDVATVASRLGHASPDTTLRVYAHMFRPSDAPAADATQAFIDRLDQDPDR